MKLDLSGQRYTASLVVTAGSVRHEILVGHFSNALCAMKSAISQGGAPESIRIIQGGRMMPREDVEVLYLRALR